MVFLPGPNYALDDTFLRDRLQKIIQDNGLEVVVETGLNDGQSTLVFSYMAPTVIAIDIDPECINCTRDRLARAARINVTLKQGNSPDMLREVVQTVPASKTLFFLDAHWGGECPILDEIRAIPRGEGVLIFHDFQVPGTDFGWDHMLINGNYHELNYEFLKKELTDWSPTHRIEYPMQVMGSKRGSAYVFPT